MSWMGPRPQEGGPRGGPLGGATLRDVAGCSPLDTLMVGGHHALHLLLSRSVLCLPVWAGDWQWTLPPEIAGTGNMRGTNGHGNC